MRENILICKNVAFYPRTSRIILNFDMIKKVKVRLMKPEAPVKADFGYVAVEIKRER